MKFKPAIRVPPRVSSWARNHREMPADSGVRCLADRLDVESLKPGGRADSCLAKCAPLRFEINELALRLCPLALGFVAWPDAREVK